MRAGTSSGRKIHPDRGRIRTGQTAAVGTTALTGRNVTVGTSRIAPVPEINQKIGVRGRSTAARISGGTAETTARTANNEQEI
jgi:hypothetical protein